MPVLSGSDLFHVGQRKLELDITVDFIQDLPGHAHKHHFHKRCLVCVFFSA